MRARNNRVNVNVEANLYLQHMKKISAEVEQKKILWFIPMIFNRDKILYSSNESQGYSEYERMAMYKAKCESGVDVVVLPEFVTRKHSWFFGIYKTYKVQMNGWGTNIKNFEKAKEDIIVVKE